MFDHKYEQHGENDRQDDEDKCSVSKESQRNAKRGQQPAKAIYELVTLSDAAILRRERRGSRSCESAGELREDG